MEHRFAFSKDQTKETNIPQILFKSNHILCFGTFCWDFGGIVYFWD